MLTEVDFSQAADHAGTLHELLSTLAGALDVRDIFRRFSAVAARIIPHDEANLALLCENDTRFRLFASTRDGEPELVCPEDRPSLTDISVPRVFRTGCESARGFHSGLRAPVTVDGKSVGVLVLLSRRPDEYSQRELNLAQCIADYLAIALSHQRQAQAAEQAALQRDRAAHLESSVELLRAIADVLDIRTVFSRVSEIANKVLAHDGLTMSFNDRDGTLVIEAATDASFMNVGPLRLQGCERYEARDKFKVVDDLRQQALPVVTPGDLQERLVAAGYRSFLGVNTSARDQAMGLEFWAKRPHAFSADDVPVARRIADHVALAVSHEQLAEAARQVAEARARAERLEARVKSLAEQLDLRTGHGRLIGESEQWRDVLNKAARVAATETTVLLSGESGTGKEVVARLVHRGSARKDGPFVALNCAALPEQLLESELFGYERGAFTGAQAAKPGQIELASGGVLFLDEVSEMSLSAQAKFLRVIQEREFQRLGGTRVLKADIRVVAATNRDLRKAVERGTFREDLFYRLQVFDIQLPPLRERRGDILLLCEAFLEEIGRSFGRPPAGLTRDAKQMLLQHDWPGNVRELRNALERAAILCEGGLIAPQHLSLHAEPRTASTPTTDLNVVERQTIERVMRDTGWNKARAARRLGLTRTQLYVRLRKHSLEPPDMSVSDGQSAASGP
ncbi:MAG: sigma 54-interacting transcriptional regulator [Bacteroidales bacterium]